MQGIAGRAVGAVAWASSMSGALAPRPSYASPLNKTVDFTYTICVPSVGQCNPPVHIHNYISSSGHVFAYHNAAGGKENTLGSSFSNGNAVGRFTVAGD